MARPTKCRRICAKPAYDSFSPNGASPGEYVLLTLDEYEAVRLIDLEKMTHEQCAYQMDISRTTVTELYESARYKIADCIVRGKMLHIAGGHYRVCDKANSCCRKQCIKTAYVNTIQSENKKGAILMKIAVTYENGDVFQHFGHTEQFKLYTVENGKITQEQVVDTNGSGHGELAGFLANAGADTLICGGIGGGAQNALQDAGITLYGGVTGKADDAVNALLNGNLAYNPDIHCNHHGHEQGGDRHRCGHHGHEQGGDGHHCGSHNCHE